MIPKSVSFFKDKNKEIAIHKASLALSTELKQLAQDKIPVLLLVSGGSALKILDNIDVFGLGPLVTLGVLDERYSTNSQVNNFCQFMQSTLYINASAKGSNFIDTRVQTDETQENLRVRFENSLVIWKDANPTGKVIVTQGIGPDGHTSGILPFPKDSDKFTELFLNPKVWVVAYDASGKNPFPYRVTTTLSFLRQVDNAFVFVSGEDKKTALSLVQADKGSLEQTPARIIRNMPKVSVFTDIY